LSISGLDKEEEEEENCIMPETVDNSFGHLRRLVKAVKNQIWYSNPPVQESTAQSLAIDAVRNERSGGLRFSTPSAKEVKKIEEDIK